MLLDFVEGSFQVLSSDTGKDVDDPVIRLEVFACSRSLLKHPFFHALTQFNCLVADQVIFEYQVVTDTQGLQYDGCPEACAVLAS